MQVGKASPTEGTLPGSIYIILKWPTHSTPGKWQVLNEDNLKIEWLLLAKWHVFFWKYPANICKIRYENDLVAGLKAGKLVTLGWEKWSKTTSSKLIAWYHLGQRHGGRWQCCPCRCHWHGPRSISWSECNPSGRMNRPKAVFFENGNFHIDWQPLDVKKERSCFDIHPPKTNMEHMEPFLKRWWFVDVFSFSKRRYCQVPFLVSLGRCSPGSWEWLEMTLTFGLRLRS